jgi:hypothetical protein
MNSLLVGLVLVTATNSAEIESYVGYGGAGTAFITMDSDGVMCMKNTLPIGETCTEFGLEDVAKINTNSPLTRGMAVHICSLEQEFTRE